MARPKADTVRVNLHMTREAAELLPRLAPTDNKQGAYVSELIRQAAIARGLLAGEVEPEGNGEVADLRRRLAEMQAEIDALARKRVPRQLQAEGESGPDSPSL